MRRPNHASRFEGIAKTKLQASRASDTETLQSQVNKAAEKRLSLSGLEVLHGRLATCRRIKLRGDSRGDAELSWAPVLGNVQVPRERPADRWIVPNSQLGQVEHEPALLG